MLLECLLTALTVQHGFSTFYGQYSDSLRPILVLRSILKISCHVFLLHRYLAYYLTTDFRKLLYRFLKLLFISPSSLVFSPPNSSCFYIPHLHALSFLLGSSFLYHHLKSSFKQETMSIIVLISFIFSTDHFQLLRI